MVDIERRDLVKGMGAVPLGLALSETAEGQGTSGGEEIWRFETPGSVHSSPTVVDGTVFVGGGDFTAIDERVDDSTLYAVDAETGKEKWRFETSHPVYSFPTVVNGTVFVGSGDETLYAVDTETGEEEWRFTEPSLSMRLPSTVVDGTVFVGSDNLYAVNAETGEEEWRFETSNVVVSSPAVSDGTVYIGSNDETFYALNTETGEEEWRFTEPSGYVHSSPMIVDGTVFFGSQGTPDDYEDSAFWAVNTGSGDELWRFTEVPGEVHSSPTVADGTVFFGSRGTPDEEYGNSALWAVDAESGDEQWRFETSMPVYSSPTVADGTVFVGTNASVLYAVDAESGDEVWRFTEPSESFLSSSPTVVDGTVFVGSDALYAIDAGVSGSSEGSRVLQGILGHHDIFAENGPTIPSDYDGSGIELGNLEVDSSEQNRTDVRDTPLETVATMFRKPSETAGLWGLILGTGVLGVGYLAYRRRNPEEEDEETVYCPDCGNEIDTSNTFCGNCGAQIDNGKMSGSEKKTEKTPGTEQTIQVSEYDELSVGDIVETGSKYQIAQANVSDTGEPVWVVTPSTEGNQTLDVSQTEDFLDDIEPWTKMDSHPNLLEVYGHGKEPLPWMAIETGDYPSVTETVDRLSQDEKIDILTQTCEAIHHVHRYGIVYESLSPESLTVTDEGQVKLRGPLDYLSGGSDTEVTERTVVYRIGNIAKYLLTSSEGRGTPDEVWAEIDMSLSENPSDRHDTVLHFRDDLRQAYVQNRR